MVLRRGTPGGSRCRRLLAKGLVTGLLLACFGAHGVRGQEAATVEPGPGCATCELEWERLLRLGAAEGRGALSDLPLDVVRDGRGRYIVLVQLAARPYVFSPEGTLLRRLGREGSGPGEFRSPVRVVVLPHDSLLILDPSNGRASLLSPSLDFVRTISLPVSQVFDAVALGGARVVLNGIVGTAA